MMGVLDHTIPLFIVFARNEHSDLPHEKTRPNHEHALSHHKKVIVETTQTQKVRKPQQQNTEPTELDCFVKCGMYILADFGAEVVFHLGVTTSYALTEFVVYWRLNFCAAII